MTAIEPLPRTGKRWRGWSTGIWLLAAGLGAMAVASTVGIVHANTQRRASARMFTHAVAAQVEALARERLEILAFEKLAPVVSGPDLDADGALGLLVAGEADARRCACRDSVDAIAFFKYSGSNARLTVRSYAAAGDNAIDRDTLAIIANAELARQTPPTRPAIHFVARKSLGGRGVVTLMLRGAASAEYMYGFVVDARVVAASLLRPAPEGEITLAKIDSSSVGMETLDSVQLAGYVRRAPGASTRTPTLEPLDAVTINVMLDQSQYPRALLGPAPQELWHLGFLLVATTIVVGIAARWSQRDLVVARARSDFVAGVSHDLRMPLAQILLASETLVSRPIGSDAERQTLTSSILREARRLVAMVENILLFSQSGSVDAEPRADIVQVAELFEDVVEAVHLAVKDAGQTIQADDAGLSVLGSKRALCQALVNLVDNSLKYGKPLQCVRLRGERRSPGIVWLTVDDEGQGVPVHERSRIFDPYHRLARDARSERTGTGLGLAVVKRIVEACGGRAWLDDARHGGARAVIELREGRAASPSAAVPENV